MSVSGTSNSPDDLDAGLSTLHIRCGSDIREGLARAGYRGDFLAFTDPVCQGPVVDDERYLARRRDFIAMHYGGHRDDIEARLTGQYDALANAHRNYERVVLWFEHDSFDQLILARVLGRLAQAGLPEIVSLICINAYPGVRPFHGLGQLSPAQLASLWAQREAVGRAHLDLANTIWQALCSDNPALLCDVLATHESPIPFLPAALRRHLQELPWLDSGLALTEKLILESLRVNPATAGHVFGDLQRNREPLPFLGDLMFWPYLRRLAGGDLPAVAMSNDDARPPHENHCELTRYGIDLLEGKLDWLATGPEVRWVGGIEITPGASTWRWDNESERPVRH